MKWLTQMIQKKNGGKRLAMMLASMVLVGVGISMITHANFGTDPFTSQNLQIAARLGVTFAIINWAVSGVLLVWSFFCTRVLLGLGTAWNILALGVIIDGGIRLWNALLPVPTMGLRVTFLVLGFFIFALGASFYFTAAMGIAAYDCLAFYIEAKTPLSFQWARISTDVFCVLMTLLLGGKVGVGTLLCALGTGPLVSRYNKYVSEPLLYGKNR